MAILNGSPFPLVSSQLVMNEIWPGIICRQIADFTDVQGFWPVGVHSPHVCLHWLLPTPVYPTDFSCRALFMLFVGQCQGKVGQLTWRPSLVSLQQGYWCSFGHWRAPVLFHKYDRMILKITIVVGQKGALKSCRRLMPYANVWACKLKMGCPASCITNNQESGTLA